MPSFSMDARTSAANVAFQVRQNAEQYRQHVQDLSSWTQEMKKKDLEAKKMKPLREPTTAPIRGQSQESSTSSESAKKERIKSHDYRAWDKFDVDEALREADEPEPPSISEVPSNSTPQEAVQIDVLEQALLEKEKGNALFKKGDYKKAVHFYTKSLQLDGNNATVYINRALAFIKLQKWKEAETDCTQALQSEPKNVKALCRRGIARRELKQYSDAVQDLELALALEPINKTVKEELEKANQLYKPKKLSSASSSIESLEGDQKMPSPLLVPRETRKMDKPAVQRRRIPIREIGGPSDVLIKEHAVLKRTPKEPIKDTDEPAIVSPVEPVKKPTVPPVEPVKKPVVSPIEPATQSTVPPVEPVKKPVVSPVEPANNPVVSPGKASMPDKPIIKEIPVRSKAPKTWTPPQSMYEFEREWKSLKNQEDVLYEYIKCISPPMLPKIFQNSLESSYLTSFLVILSRFYIRDHLFKEAVVFLYHLSQVKRFDMACLFMTRQDKHILSGLLTALSSDSSVDSDLLKQVLLVYKV